MGWMGADSESAKTTVAAPAGSCLEVMPLPGRYYSHLGKVRPWAEVTKDAGEIVRLASLRGWGEWTAVFRVATDGEADRYYLVVEE
jgi:hypothetical protein